MLTTHHWSDPAAGLRELRRVSRRQVVLTWDPALVAERFWLVRDLLPEIVVHEAGLATLGAVLAGLPDARVEPVPVPHDCTDGFLAAHWRRPQAYLDPVVRAGMSSFALLDPSVVTAALERLAVVVQDGTWEREHADLLAVDELDVGYRLVIAGD